jgi:hypothetical protein
MKLAEDEHLTDLVEFALFTGMRRGEALETDLGARDPSLRHLAPEHLRSGRSMRAKVQRSGRPASSYLCAPSLDTVPLAHDTPATSN